jgi:hypothetical protein
MKNLFIRYYNTLNLKLVACIMLSMFLSGCLSVKPSTTKSGKNYFESFYVGAEGTQYFIKPILLKDEKSKEDLVLDITFRYRNEIKDSAIVNFSIEGPMIYKTIDSLGLSNNTIVVKSNNLNLLFNEKNKTGFTSRYSTKISLNEIKELFSNEEWKVNIYNQNKINTFKPYGKSPKAINIIRDKVFIIM